MVSVPSRTGWRANFVCDSLVIDNDYSRGFHLKSDHYLLIVTTGGHGGPPLRGKRSRYAARLYKRGIWRIVHGARMDESNARGGYR